MDLKQIGFDEHFEKEFSRFKEEGYDACRIAVPNKTNYTLYSEQGEITGELSGKFYFEHDDNTTTYPVVGDWVAVRMYPEDRKALIDYVLPRKTIFSRKMAGTTTEEQVLAANVDVIFVMTSVNLDINARRLERFLTVINDRSIKPVLLLTKADLTDDRQSVLDEIKEVLKDSEYHFISVVTNEGMEDIKKYFDDNSTVALIGTSGVGKTTLINKLIPGIDLRVEEIGKYKDKGRHTTTRRELYILPDGGMIIDNPGIRELQLWDGSEGITESFPEIEKYITQCKFSDCKHESEPGCAVKEAMERGEFSQERYKSYVKLQKEIDHFQRKIDVKAALDEKKKWKKISNTAKEILKHKYLKK